MLEPVLRHFTQLCYLTENMDVNISRLPYQFGHPAAPLYTVLERKYYPRLTREINFPHRWRGMRSSPPERRRSPRITCRFPSFCAVSTTQALNSWNSPRPWTSAPPALSWPAVAALHPNQLLRITIPVSSEPVSGLIPAETPPIQPRVRRSVPAGDTHLIGVEFLSPRLSEPESLDHCHL